MKRQKMITLDEELIDLLREIPNSSGLINNLLTDYFEKLTNPNEKFKEINEIIEKKKQESKKLKQEIAKINQKRAEIVKKEVKKDEKIKENDKIIIRREQMFRDSFKTWDIPKEKIEQELKEYSDIFYNVDKSIKIVVFLTEKGYKKKPKRKREPII